ncbi:amidase signature domain-containing protein [Neohortaea acidophila]|uniref:Amidase signature domain-containing protein n=1 Tax=Neohortaea acidophila TaxID=245834 RepID=A0A6A6PK05_9PEZI|nr:amidase signature domain-containing protein [Neohortaea acidophila]KAF2480408.1 amidase signature domain-containing protein [Neohortaea acidophila]
MELPSARPYTFRFTPESTAFIIIDMQRDFLDPNGFGAIQCGNDDVFREVRSIVPKTQAVLEACRKLGLYVVHTREGHQPNLSDLPPSKRLRQISAPNGHHTIGIGDEGPMGRLLVRGEYGHDIIDELRPVPGEVVIDKPGKGSFWDTTLHRALLARGITHLIVAGVTTECCVNTTFREAADRGFECCVLNDCTSGFDASFYTSALDMLCSYDGLFGYVGTSDEVLQQMAPAAQLATPPTTPPGFQGDISLAGLQRQYSARLTSPTEVIKGLSLRIAEYQQADPAVWIHLESPETLLHSAKALEERFHGKPLPPLYGVPFAVKDNIDVGGIKTTVACEEYAYTPERSARVVDAMIAAGGIFIGKTNLDQLATGLSGCRSPHGSPHSVFSPNHISGGSSSGSAVAVAAGLVSFAVSTDTAGSGRVPAMFNGVTGYKPTRGTLSAQGLVPACKSLDTITIIAPTVEEARKVWLVADEGPDPADPYAKTQQSLALWHVDFRGPKAGGFNFGVPPQSALQACTPAFQQGFTSAIARLERAGGTRVEIDWTPFQAGNDLLYEGALVQERIASIGATFIKENLSTFDPAVSSIFSAALAKEVTAPDVFRDLHLQAESTRYAAAIFRDEIDVLLVPTTTCHPTFEEMRADPIALNSRLGAFTHFGNVLDLCGLAVPAGTYVSEGGGGETLPFGVTLLGASGRDGRVFDIAREFERTK